MLLESVFGRQKQAEICKLKAGLIEIVCPRPARLQRELVSKKKKSE